MRTYGEQNVTLRVLDRDVKNPFFDKRVKHDFREFKNFEAGVKFAVARRPYTDKVEGIDKVIHGEEVTIRIYGEYINSFDLMEELVDASSDTNPTTWWDLKKISDLGPRMLGDANRIMELIREKGILSVEAAQALMREALDRAEKEEEEE